MFMYWCGITNVKIERTFAEYFNEGYSCKGKYETVMYKAINRIKNTTRSMKDDKDYLLFSQRTNLMLKQKLST